MPDTDPPISDTLPPPHAIVADVLPPRSYQPGGHVLLPIIRTAEPACANPGPVARLSFRGEEPRHCSPPHASPYARTPDEPISLRLVDGFERAIPVRA